MSRKIPGSKYDKLVVAGLAAGLLGIVVVLLFPEVRRKLGLEKPALAPLALAEAPKSQLSLPQPQKAPRTTKAKQASSSSQPPPLVVTVQQNNSGGINIQQATTAENSPIVNKTITVETIPRRMSTNDVLAAKQYLSNSKRQARVKIAVDGGNSVDFANDFYRTLEDAGWPMEDAGVDHFIGFAAPEAKRFQGAVVIVRGEPLKPSETVYFEQSDPVTYIVGLLDLLKVPHILRRELDRPEGLILVQFEGGLPN